MTSTAKSLAVTTCEFDLQSLLVVTTGSCAVDERCGLSAAYPVMGHMLGVRADAFRDPSVLYCQARLPCAASILTQHNWLPDRVDPIIGHRGDYFPRVATWANRLSRLYPSPIAIQAMSPTELEQLPAELREALAFYLL